MRGKLSPKLQSFIDAVNIAAAEFKASGAELTPIQARKNLAKLSAFLTQTPTIAAHTDSAVIVNNRNIPVRLFSASTDQALPLVIYFHGGGHMCGDIELYDSMCRKIANAGQCHVLSVEYRLSPEHPYPAGIEDAELVIEHIDQITSTIDFDGQLCIAGDSAGGAICTSILMRRATGQSLSTQTKIDKQILIYPSVDYTGSTESFNTNGVGYLLENSRINWYFDHYFMQGTDRREASPLFGPLPRVYPKTLVITADCDPLRDEGELYVTRLMERGIPVEHKQFKGMIHAFMNLEDLVETECQTLYQHIGAFIQG